MTVSACFTQGNRKDDTFVFTDRSRVVRISESDQNFWLSCRGTQTPQDCRPGINKLRRVSA